MDHPFRNAAFGGFNRQDVLTYLENTAKEAAQRQAELQKQLDEVQSAAAQQNARLSEQDARIRQLTQDCESLRTQLEQANVALSASRIDCGQSMTALETVRREAEEWKAKAAALEPDAQAYAAIKERTAGVELDAHRRAQNVQDKAEQQARELRRQMEQWMQKVEREYDALRSEVESTVSHAASQLEKAGQHLEQVTALMGEQELALETLTKAYDDTDPAAKVEPPMPIPED